MTSKHKKARKEFESFFPPPEGMVWGGTGYERGHVSILFGDCVKWDRMLQVWLTAQKHFKKRFEK